MDNAQRLRKLLDNEIIAFNEVPLQIRAIRANLEKTDAATLISLQTIDHTLRQHLDQLATEAIDDWSIVGLAIISIYENVISSLLHKTLAVSEDLFYWQDMIDNKSVVNIGLFGLQRTPGYIFHQCITNYKTIYSNVQRLCGRLGSFERLIDRESMKQQIKVPISAVVYCLQYPIRTIRTHFKGNYNQLIECRNNRAEMLGLLVSKGLTYESFTVHDRLNSIAVLKSQLDVSDEIDLVGKMKQMNSRQVVEVLIDLIPMVNKYLQNYDNQVKLYKKPSILTRYWPAIITGIIFTYKIIGQWQTIYSFISNQLIGSCISLWNNWIADPLIKIYQTIRHDENAQIALMTKQSLDADMRSLERMVIDFARDLNPQYTAVYSTDSIVESVKQGDLSIVLRPYEQELQTPIKSLISGQLVRSLLIQVQKTKVDVEIAMNGIDKLLQSQQLVFGLIAALPGVSAGYWLLTNLKKWMNGEFKSFKTMTKTRQQLSITLTNIYHLLNKTEGYQSIGLILCEAMILRQLGRSFITSKLQYDQWLYDIQQVESVSANAEYKRHLIERMWITYKI